MPIGYAIFLVCHHGFVWFWKVGDMVRRWGITSCLLFIFCLTEVLTDKANLHLWRKLITTKYMFFFAMQMIIHYWQPWKMPYNVCLILLSLINNVEHSENIILKHKTREFQLP